MSSTPTLWLDGGDWDIDADMSEKLAATGEFGAPAAPLTSGFGALVAAAGDTTPIDDLLAGALAQRSSAPTRYFRTLQGEELAAHLTAFEGRVVWRYVRFGPEDQPDYQRWVPYRVRRGRT